jgi:hypothetical protein
MRIRYRGLDGLSEIGFKKQEVVLEDLFPTADRLVLSMKAYFQRLEGAASILSEIPEARFGVVEEDHILELAVPKPRGEYVGVIIDVLALDIRDAATMMDDIENTCGFVRARFSEVMGLLEMSENDYLRRLSESMRLLATELRR